ncbi:hypothetical protein GJ654_02900 [Rhodoblastus acidophilus]|uniref:Uncharacterized protein n=1 Tax=Rhodoblastus acidophilus TaxID=1074 RepID=A0A6N8DI81_RHOAC|nr:hypothetical protein [Rhodoblastus acidophilus]MCW2273037.1 tetratricopeptide (TPR) repeat protein [Rhodoblastus acidophilus]MTV29938.1 hypothetical protein [Rhodoblastus acidophilus]
MDKTAFEAEPDVIRVRIAVSDRSDHGQITVVTFETSPTTQFQFSTAADATHRYLIDDCAKEAINAVKAANTVRADDWFENLVADICVRLEARGLGVDRLPAADVELKFEIDLRSGVLVGRSQALHPFAKADDAITRGVREAISKAFDPAVETLLKALKVQISAGEHAEAARLITENENAHLAILSRHNGLLDTICQIDRSKLTQELRIALQRVLITFAGNQSREELVGDDAEDLLREDIGLDHEARIYLQTFIGVAAIRRGRDEYAISTWRGLLRTPGQITARQRGWIWRNLSMALGNDEPEAIRAAENAIDAFLEAGDKREAAKSINQLSVLLEKTEPKNALQQYDRMLTVISRNGVMDDEICANIFHAKALKQLDSGDPGEALQSAKAAIKVREGLIGVEEALLSSMHLAAICALNVGLEHEHLQIDAAIKQLESQLKSGHFKIARRVQSLLVCYKEDEARELLREVEGKSDELFAGVSIAAAIKNPNLTPIQRIGKLEATLRELEQRKVHEDTKYPARLAIAQILRDEGEWLRAAKWYYKILECSHMNILVKQLLIDTLWQAKEWGSAATFIKQELDAVGDRPGLLYAYGISLYEDGRYSDAVKALHDALRLADRNETLQEKIRALRDQALDRGGTIMPRTTPISPDAPVTLDYIGGVLSAFRDFISGSERMGFWHKSDKAKDYEWISSPERHGQKLLRAFAKGHFLDRVDEFEELWTGAGRLDVLLKFAGGLSIIIELKMCGFRYSSNYAASGETQIRHYMRSRNVHVGFLIVFDARLQQNGEKLLVGATNSQDTIDEILIDVRPRVT